MEKKEINWNSLTAIIENRKGEKWGLIPLLQEIQDEAHSSGRNAFQIPGLKPGSLLLQGQPGNSSPGAAVQRFLRNFRRSTVLQNGDRFF